MRFPSAGLELWKRIDRTVVHKNRIFVFKKWPSWIGKIINDLPLKPGSIPRYAEPCREKDTVSDGKNDIQPTVECIPAPQK